MSRLPCVRECGAPSRTRDGGKRNWERFGITKTKRGQRTLETSTSEGGYLEVRRQDNREQRNRGVYDSSCNRTGLKPETGRHLWTGSDLGPSVWVVLFYPH